MVDRSYPVDLQDNVAKLLRAAQHKEYEEHDDTYKHFSDKANEEGFTKIASSFKMIGEIEKSHGDRFGRFAELLEILLAKKHQQFAQYVTIIKAILLDWN